MHRFTVRSVGEPSDWRKQPATTPLSSNEIRCANTEVAEFLDALGALEESATTDKRASLQPSPSDPDYRSSGRQLVARPWRPTS